MTDEDPHRGTALGTAWLTTLRRFFAFVIPAHLAWEMAQLPLYTIWYEAAPSWIALAVVHCWGGDALITSATLMGALLLVGNSRWPNERFVPVALSTVLAGVAYTGFSEWQNTEVRSSWAYSWLMPTLLGIGTGLSPLLQWLVVPLAAFWWARSGQIQTIQHTAQHSAHG